MEENKALLRKGIKAMNEGKNPAVLDEFVALDYVDHTNQLNREGAKEFYTQVFQGFPDYHRTIRDIIAEGDKVWVYSVTTGTHTGEFRGVASTGKRVTITGVNIYRIIDGKMAEGWSVTDSMDLLKQLGWIEYTEKAKGLTPEEGPSPPVPNKRERRKSEKRSSTPLAENKAIVRRWIEELNQRNPAVLDELMAPDFYHPTRHLRGPEEYKELITMMTRAFPDWHETLEDIVAEGDSVWHRFTVTGTHHGEFMGVAPTDKKVTWTGVNFWRIVDGKVVEKESLHDMVETLTQLGVIAYTEKAKTLVPDEGS